MAGAPPRAGATHHDRVFLAEFLKVMNLMQPPTSRVRPAILWRVLAGRRTAQAPAMPAVQPASGD
jgi:hypothetical protein